MKKYLWLIIAAVLVIWGISSYNGIVSQEEGVKAQWSKVESSYQRRMDLIPNLVNTVKGYADFEQETLTAVTKARASASQTVIDPTNLNQSNIAQFQQAQGELSSALSRLLVTIEKYPDLKANQNFLELQSQLEGTENRINVERNRYNDAAKGFNAKIRRIPTNLVANLAGVEQFGYFEAQAGAENAPQVQF
jgi:LemA protein